MSRCKYFLLTKRAAPPEFVKEGLFTMNDTVIISRRGRQIDLYTAVFEGSSQTIDWFESRRIDEVPPGAKPIPEEVFWLILKLRSLYHPLRDLERCIGDVVGVLDSVKTQHPGLARVLMNAWGNAASVCLRTEALMIAAVKAEVEIIRKHSGE